MGYNTSLELFGLIAGAITSMGFVPQLIRGYRTKKLIDISYYMPIILAIGMSFWFIYGLFQEALAVMVANIFGVASCIVLLFMKRRYS